METIAVEVAAVDLLNPLIRRFTLRAVDGRALPGFSAGAHVRVQVGLPGKAQGEVQDWRHYSLVNTDAGTDTGLPQPQYTIAVRNEDRGRGGSRWMHALQVGQRIVIEPPKNDFPLGTHPGCAVLVAGGIGITPLASMAAARRAAGLPVRMLYAGRSHGQMAFVPELQALLGDSLALHADEDHGAPPDVAALLDGCSGEDQLYVCGPRVMLDAVLAASDARGWPRERVHFELFTAPVAAAGDQSIELVLAQSGRQLTVPAGQSILDCLIEHGCDPLFDCKRGECGVCAAQVIEGEIDHRDAVLSAAERAGGTVMQICVSRARSARLVLDL
ncbi:PDR/VanB family oxidoreductase [Comamonas testosteroni]|uniref:PDR/VanB family oxidoreductase n=1 Tax=Comamonas testosteroni TaxID=285 RepID=UPI0025FFBB95|nr:PDR/VanB family oxidoreductase [Comamonas testosteroni]MEB5966336.1 PDR/VanB family oxidoreductase [Comamonas testosteroni]